MNLKVFLLLLTCFVIACTCEDSCVDVCTQQAECIKVCNREHVPNHEPISESASEDDIEIIVFQLKDGVTTDESEGDDCDDESKDDVKSSHGFSSEELNSFREYFLSNLEVFQRDIEDIDEKVSRLHNLPAPLSSNEVSLNVLKILIGELERFPSDITSPAHMLQIDTFLVHMIKAALESMSLFSYQYKVQLVAHTGLMIVNTYIALEQAEEFKNVTIHFPYPDDYQEERAM